MSNTENNDKPESSPPEPKPAPKTAAPASTDDRRKGKTPSRRRRIGRLVARLFLLLLVIGGLGVAGWFGWQWLLEQKAGYDDTIAAQSAAIARLDAQLDRVAETGVAQDEFEALRDRMNVIANDMDALREAARGGRRDLVRAEIEYLLRIAADTLYLMRDVDTAIYALQAADDRLRQLAEPRLMPVRQLISDHLQELGAVSVPDINGMALKLNSLMREVSEMPLRQTEHARAIDATDDVAPAGAGWWERLRSGVARLFDKLVTVQRAEPPPPLLRPDEHFFLYRNVELQLSAARAALLAGDPAAYRQSLETAREWLNRYFDVQDPAVANAIADINGLLEVSLQPSLPDITPALERLRSLNGDGPIGRLESPGARTE